MIERGYFSHEIAGSGRHVWDLMSDRGYCYRLAGENIGWNQYYPDGQETAEIQQAFMSSPGHRENLLGPDWEVVGIGAYKGSDGKAMWTVVFADKCGAVAATTSAPSTAKTASAKKPSVTVPTTPGPRLVGSLTSIRQAGRTVTWRWAALDRVTLSAALAAASPPESMLPSLDEALQRLEALDPEQARIVELRYFVGLSIEDAAVSLKLSPATLKRRWALARAWLFRELSGETP